LSFYRSAPVGLWDADSTSVFTRLGVGGGLRSLLQVDRGKVTLRASDRGICDRWWRWREEVPDGAGGYPLSSRLRYISVGPRNSLVDCW